MSAIESIFGMMSDRVPNGKQAQILTPPHIVKEMVDALPAEVFNKDTTFLDICCKSGIFLYKIYQKLMESPSMQADFPDEINRAKHIINNQLFGIAPNRLCQALSTRTVYGYLEPDSHIIYINEYELVMRNADRTFLYNTLQKEFNMKGFGVVIGNPPYNKGMDLDFVDAGYKLSSNITCMITPAKWQTAADDYSGCASKNIDYKQFREKYVPHMSKVCFYPQSIEIFDIYQIDGITWYIIDKEKHEKVIIENKCKVQPYFNSIVERPIQERESLLNIGIEIVNSFGNYNRFKFPYVHMKRYEVWTNNQVSGSGSRFMSDDGTTTTIGLSRILDKQKGETSPSGASNCIFSSDSKEECEYFISWINCKFTRFFVAINISKLTGILTDDCFRFVPAPPSGKFDHIYTDEELYKAFNLPQKYIDVIESVIKERK